MSCRLARVSSSLDQARQARVAAIGRPKRGLSIDDRALLEQLLTEKYEYVVNELFDLSDRQARHRIFNAAPEIGRPDTSWYHPVMDNLVNHQQVKRNNAVLLTAKQEQALFLQYNYCRYRVCRLRDQIQDQNTIKVKVARQMLDWYRKAQHYREQIAQTNLALVLAMAKRTHMNEVDFGDLVSEGNMALLRAVDKFDVARGFKFSTYACRAILKSFSRAGMKLSKYRSLFPTEFDPTLEKSDYMEHKRIEHEEDCVDALKIIIKDNRAMLSQIETQVIKHRFALETNPDNAAEPAPMTLKEVGRIIGVTKERVRQIQNKALDKIKVTLEDGFLE